jgi:hypothetical protein
MSVWFQAAMIFGAQVWRLFHFLCLRLAHQLQLVQVLQIQQARLLLYKL